MGHITCDRNSAFIIRFVIIGRTVLLCGLPSILGKLCDRFKYRQAHLYKIKKGYGKIK